MTDRPESVADIVAELREHSGETNPTFLCFEEDGGIDVSELADRVEAAHVRELHAVQEVAENALCDADAAEHQFRDATKKVGNAAKLREALERELKIHIGYNEHLDAKRVRAALAAPPRNCDVGTAEEQKERMADWCHRTHCGNCPYCTEWCALSWANAPYDAEKEGGDHAEA